MPLIRTDNGGRPPPPPTADEGQDADPAAALRGGAQPERWAAARALGDRPGAVAALAAALPAEGDNRVREAIFTSLARIGSADSVEALVSCLRMDELNLRTGALDALRTMTEAVRPRLANLLADADPDVRVLSCELARDLPAAEATRLLCAVLDHDPQANVCGAAVDVLADVGEAAALPHLEACARRLAGDGFLGFAIRIAVERIADQRPGRDE